MRITQSMLVQQAIGALKQGNEMKSLETGAQVTAKIAAVSEGLLTLQLSSGELIQARDLSDKVYLPGQQMTFEIIGKTNEGELALRALGEDLSKNVEDSMVSVLNKLNLKDTPDNRDLIRQFTAFRIPFTNENIKAAQNLKAQASSLTDLISNGKVVLETRSSHETLRALIGKAVGGDGSPVVTDVSKNEGENVKTSENTVLVKTAESVVVHSKTNDSATSSLISKEVPKESLTNVTEIKTSEARVEQDKALTEKGTQKILENSAGNTTEARLGEIKSMLKQFDMEKIAFMIKNQLPPELGVVENLDKLLLGKKQLNDQLQYLMQLLPKDEKGVELKTVIDKILSTVHLKETLDPLELKDQIKNLNKAFEELGSSLAERGEMKASLREAMGEVKNSIDFLSKINETATYLHVPILTGKDSKQLDLYVQRDKSGTRRINPKDTKIFISLETNHLETVQCLAEIKEKRLNLGFRVADDEVMNIFESKFSELKERLENLGFSDVNIHCMVTENKLTLLDLVQDSPLEIGRVDIRV